MLRQALEMYMPCVAVIYSWWQTCLSVTITIVYSTPAILEKREERRYHPTQRHTTTNTNTKLCSQTLTHDMRAGHQEPSLENWGGGLKSILWLANSPHTPSVQTKIKKQWQHTEAKWVRMCNSVYGIEKNIQLNIDKVEMLICTITVLSSFV